MSHELLSELDRALSLVAKATEGPWQSKNDYDYDEIIGAIDGPDDGQMHYTHVCTTHDCPEEIYNAAAIAAAVNLLRQHGQELRALVAGDGVWVPRAELEQLRKDSADCDYLQMVDRRVGPNRAAALLSAAPAQREGEPFGTDFIRSIEP